MHILLEQYLTDLQSSIKLLPRRCREAELTEMRQHLEAAFAANIASGETDDSAARSAVASFGKPELVGDETVKTWKRGVATDSLSIVAAIAVTIITRVLFGYFASHIEPHGFRRILPENIAMIVVECAATGLTVGLLFPKRAVIAVSASYMLFFVYIAWFVIIAGPGPELGSNLVMEALSMFVPALLTATVATAASQWRTKRLQLIKN